jgi:diaminopimelate epimerase
MSLRLYKYQGLGNDFILINRYALGLPADPGGWARRLCDRRLGVGGDGVLFLLAPEHDRARVRMRIFNADGSEAEMCGNGLRCLALHWREEMGGAVAFTVETMAGLRHCRITAEMVAGRGDVCVSMGRPQWKRRAIPMTGEQGDAIRIPITVADCTFRLTAVSMGNPHAVIFLDESDGAGRRGVRAGGTAGALETVTDWARRFGPQLETHPLFPQRANISFVRLRGGQRLEAAVWERGVGLTQACGTGACAIAVAACLEGRLAVGSEIVVQLPGGALGIVVACEYEEVTMNGPAARSFVAVTELEKGGWHP